MKVAVCSTGDNLDSQTDPRFGRCANFVIVDTETFDANAIPNPAVTAAQGAGVEAAQLMTSQGVSAIITGNLGPNAHLALKAAGIKAYQCSGETVRYAVGLFNAGSLTEIEAANVEAHSGMSAAPGRGMGQGRGMGRGGGGGGRGRGRQ